MSPQSWFESFWYYKNAAEGALEGTRHRQLAPTLFCCAFAVTRIGDCSSLVSNESFWLPYYVLVTWMKGVPLLIRRAPLAASTTWVVCRHQIYFIGYAGGKKLTATRTRAHISFAYFEYCLILSHIMILYICTCCAILREVRADVGILLLKPELGVWSHC